MSAAQRPSPSQQTWTAPLTRKCQPHTALALTADPDCALTTGPDCLWSLHAQLPASFALRGSSFFLCRRNFKYHSPHLRCPPSGLLCTSAPKACNVQAYLLLAIRSGVRSRRARPRLLPFGYLQVGGTGMQNGALMELDPGGMPNQLYPLVCRSGTCVASTPGKASWRLRCT